jgi:TRAP-type C4-dicarboxylate transport system permease small subunit
MLVVVVLLVHVVVDVTIRYATGQGLPGTIDFVGNWWMPALTFAALGAVERAGRQIEASFLRDRLDRRSGAVARTLSAVLSVFVCLAMGVAGFVGAMAHMERGEAAIGGLAFPIWPARFLVPLGMLALLLGVLVPSLKPGEGDRSRPHPWGIE